MKHKYSVSCFISTTKTDLRPCVLFARLKPFVFVRHSPTLIQCSGNLTPEVDSVKAEAVINGQILQQSPLAARVSLAPNIQLNLQGSDPLSGFRGQLLPEIWPEAKRLLLSLLQRKDETAHDKLKHV